MDNCNSFNFTGNNINVNYSNVESGNSNDLEKLGSWEPEFWENDLLDNSFELGSKPNFDDFDFPSKEIEKVNSIISNQLPKQYLYTEPKEIDPSRIQHKRKIPDSTFDDLDFPLFESLGTPELGGEFSSKTSNQSQDVFFDDIEFDWIDPSIFFSQFEEKAISQTPINSNVPFHSLQVMQPEFESKKPKETKRKKRRNSPNEKSQPCSYGEMKMTIGNKLSSALPLIQYLNDRYVSVLEKFETGIYPEKPKGLVRELMPYQWRGYQWMKIFYQLGIGGCLGDEMGLGKTIQSIAFIQEIINQKNQIKEKARIFISCPALLIENWKNEIGSYCPELSKKIANKEGESAEISFISHQKLRGRVPEKNKEEQLFPFDQQWDVVIIDECHMLLNSKPSKKAMDLLRQKAAGPYTGFICLTGTPMPNNLSELYQLNAILNPDVYPNKLTFFKNFIAPANSTLKNFLSKKDIHLQENESIPQLEKTVLELLEMLAKPFFMRRTKNGKEFKSQTMIMQKLGSSVQSLKPIASENWVSYPLTHQQQILVNAIKEKNSSEKKIEELVKLDIDPNDTGNCKKRKSFLRDNLWMQQIANHESSVLESKKLKEYLNENNSHLCEKIKPFNPSLLEEGKLKSIAIIVKNILQIASDDKILIFTNFKHMGGLICKVLTTSFPEHKTMNKINFLYGEKKKVIRSQIIEDFKKTEGPPVLVVGRKLGSVGWNGTAANHVIIVDPWWNPGDDDQCIARCHRIGQKKLVHVYRLHQEEFEVDKKMRQIRIEKRTWCELLLSESNNLREKISEIMEINKKEMQEVELSKFKK